MRLPEALFTCRIVVIWSDGLRDSPISHREFGIKFSCVFERARCLVVIKRVDQAQSLIKKLLGRQVTSGDGMMKIAQA